MTVEIHRPELEALIKARLKNGMFQDVEDVLLRAMQLLPPDFVSTSVDPTGADLIAAMQASPHKDISLEPRRAPLPVRDVDF